MEDNSGTNKRETDNLRKEIEAWEKVSDETWQLLDKEIEYAISLEEKAVALLKRKDEDWKHKTHKRQIRCFKCGVLEDVPDETANYCSHCNSTNIVVRWIPVGGFLDYLK